MANYFIYDYTVTICRGHYKVWHSEATSTPGLQIDPSCFHVISLLQGDVEYMLFR